MLYTSFTLIAMQGHQPDKKAKAKQKQCSTSSNMVVIKYCFIIGCRDKTSTWYLNEFPDVSDLRGRKNRGWPNFVFSAHIFLCVNFAPRIISGSRNVDIL